ncbi:hypothetical protein DPMN_133773 [Dreissena polymorpha]|uniref:Uncharacterized protein n=1 Tax=Dreissena polymorpha TaxID=45954 RepID=A0A9D4FYY1_DREPO|nr:hypothetical protein DPMN_133773 [Dreissena polymorpha]
MTLRDFRKELPVSVQEYNTMMTKTIISCDVSVHLTLPCSKANFGSHNSPCLKWEIPVDNFFLYELLNSC